MRLAFSFLDMMDKVLIVDGHSVVFSTADLAEVYRGDGRVARNMLMRELTLYQDMNEVSVVLVFDGRGKTLDSEPRQDKDILVMYSRDGQTADTVIERIVAKHAVSYDVTVVSNDRMVLDTISAFGAHPMSVRMMWEIV